MLGQIANYCHVICCTSMVENSTSIQSLWNTIREHYGFHVTSAHFFDFTNLHLEADERPQGSISATHGLTWLKLIHLDFPKLVKQRYGTELRSRTLASIKRQIFQALSSLLDKLRAADDAKIMRIAITNSCKPANIRAPNRTSTRPYRPSSSCPL